MCLQAQALLMRVQGLHMQLFFNQHSLDVVASCIYAVSRVAGPPLSFRSITRTIAALFPLQVPHLFVDADIGAPPADGAILPTPPYLLREIYSGQDVSRCQLQFLPYESLFVLMLHPFCQFT